MYRTIAAFLLTGVFAAAGPVSSQGTQPVRACESLMSLKLPNTTIDSAAIEASGNRPPACRVTASVTHPPAGDRVRVFIGLPLTNWNGRFQGLGGGGFSGGSPN